MSVHTPKRRLHRLAIRAALVATLAGSLAQPAAADFEAEAKVEAVFLRVRSTDSAIAAFIELAATRSRTFRRLLGVIQASDGIVYVEPGVCGHGTRACLKGWMVASGPNRFLRVIVDRRKADSDIDFMGTIGHELQHTVEALSDPATINTAALYHFFSRIAPTHSRRFETIAAINAGDAVRNELSRRRTD